MGNSYPHELFMRECIRLARIALQQGESPVGSVLVKEGQIIGRGIEGGKKRLDITYHAEIEAIREATAYLGTQDLSGCVMYTTHEPCIMCSYVIRHTKISTVVAGLAMGETGGTGPLYPLLKDEKVSKWGEPPTIITGVLEEECKALHMLP